MKQRAYLVSFACWFLFASQAHSQRLIYTITYGETAASFRARFGNNTWQAPINQKLAMLRRTRKTEIYSVSMPDGKRSLLFSDEGLNFEVQPSNGSGYPLSRDKVYLKGVEREWHGQPNPGAYETPPALYEITLDGSGKFRRLFEVKQNMSPGVLNPAGTRAAFQGFDNDRFTYLIYDVPSWKLLRNGDLTKMEQTHCAGCLPLSPAWFADGSRLFITLQLGDDDGDPGEPQGVPGAYIISEDGSDLGGIPPQAGRVQMEGYVRQVPDPPNLIGQSSDGNYIFRDYALKKGPLPKAPVISETFIVITGPDFAVKKQILLQKLGWLGQFQLSTSGKYLAFMEGRPLPNYTTEGHLWAKDLQSGEEKELFVVPPPNPPLSQEPNLAVVPLGWVGK